DVSHMGPSFLSLKDRGGNDAEARHRAVAAIAERLVCGDIAGLSPGQLRYTLLMNDQGGVIDDLMIGRPADPAWSGVLYVIVNAGGKDADFAHFGAAGGGRAKLRRSDDFALLALQGQDAASVIGPRLPDVLDLTLMTYR